MSAAAQASPAQGATVVDAATTAPRAEARPGAQIAVLFCVEAGPMETQAVLLAESLRKWGGRLADAQAVAVQPRSGPSLGADTRAAFDRLGVRHERIRPTHSASWYGTINKPTSLAWAEKHLDAEVFAWFDTDTLIVREPTLLDLPDGVDLAARPAEAMLGSTGPDDVHEPYWQAVCASLGFSAEDLPWIDSRPEGKPIRMYLHGGVYAFRKSLGLAGVHLQTYLSRLESKIASPQHGVYFYDQTSFSLSAHRVGARVLPLEDTYNYNLNWRAKDWITDAGVAGAKVIHYHDSLWPAHFDWFLDLIEAHHPEPAAWLRERGPVTVSMPPLARVWRKALKWSRDRKYKRFAASAAPPTHGGA
ncbi:MAG: hypothetical protein AAF612_04885 [Planctomycetota bacterium]